MQECVLSRKIGINVAFFARTSQQEAIFYTKMHALKIKPMTKNLEWREIFTTIFGPERK
jgi:hypothetical protein